jgi:hypothetical protein
MKVADKDTDHATSVSESRPGQPVLLVLNRKATEDGSGQMAKVAKSDFAQITGEGPQGVHVMLDGSIT